MFLKTSRALTFCGILAIAGSGNEAFGQLFNNCCCCPPPVQCCPLPPIIHQQATLQTVPVTEYHAVKQTVQRPVIETTYVDQPVTEYRQVVENQTAVVPHVAYQNVTEYQTVQRDAGRWVTQYQTRPQMSPCEYDCRPDLFGWLNRTGYSARMAFTPKVYAEKTYVPNIVTQSVPIVRQVAVQGSHTVNYQVARMVPYTTTRKVAVNKVKMVAQEITTHHPVTVMKTMSVGTGLAYGSSFVPAPGAIVYGQPAAAPRTATLQPVPDASMSGKRSATLQPTPDPFSTATRPKSDSIKVTPKAPASLPDSLNNEADEMPEAKPASPNKKTSLSRPSRVTPSHYEDAAPGEEQSIERATYAEPEVASTTPSAVRVGRWVARRTPRPSGPVIPDTTISVASTKKAR